ncbi:exocyst complex component EXO70A1-like [Phragmites australis]|uniref:exocyst complex component EXO70A1-like n=1 Tax=Phragmites australis TaxID=29695 RepID=UPI002D7939E7|nr:exocyst complex component EXO70A1-like [Phragmites australis]
MGAAVGKAAEDFAGAPKTQATARLDLAEHAILQWNRSPGADSGIWDAEANYTNKGLLSAVDDVLLLVEEDPFPTAASSARRRLDSVVGVAMARMVEEFLRVKVWNVSQLRFAVDKLSLASSGVSLVAFPSAGDRTSTASTGGEFDASDGSQSRSTSTVPDEVAALLDGEFLDELDLICPAGVSVLHEIVLRVIRAGCTKDLLRAFANAPCDVLDRFLSILRVECSRRTTEVVIRRWTLVTKVIGKAVVAMRRQLYAQDPGAFDGFKDEYLLAIAENRTLILLKFADEFTSITSHEKLMYILGMYEALSDAAPSLLLLFSGARKELISEKTQDILTKLADVVKTMIGSLMAKIQSDWSHTPSATDGVHPLTRYDMACVELLAPHRTALDVILANGDGDGAGAPAGGAERVTSFGSLVSELIVGLERNLEEKPALACAAAGGSPHLFLANNISFLLNRAADADVTSLLGDEWAARRRNRLERHTASYVEVSWGPVVACLEMPVGGNDKPTKVLSKFNAAFKRAHGSQVCREVPDPALRAALRKAVSEMVVPAYCAFLQKHPKLGKSVRYTADDLAESLSELFEGDAADGTKS